MPFSLEQRIGSNMMKKLNWGVPEGVEAKQEAIFALTHCFGLLLNCDPKKLIPGHPLHCELNMAIAEGRDPKGCDCNGPDDPLEAK
ncbi:hypothetical protein AYO40_03525 [Planctomycetaceae bacterium SCGC AG-212-D15]|nr:hypothetical protein AYO40_03525 [Planctomycetaceae bacterium SCGC AG-212-D15]